MTAIFLWALLAATGVMVVFAASRLWQLTRPVEVKHTSPADKTVAADRSPDLVIVERVSDPPSDDPTGTETLEVDIDASEALESSLPSTDPATVEADELVLTDPIDVHHHHH